MGNSTIYREGLYRLTPQANKIWLDNSDKEGSGARSLTSKFVLVFLLS